MLTSCESDDVIYIDCDCGYIVDVDHYYNQYGHVYDIIDIETDCGYVNYDIKTYRFHYVDEYVCYEYH